MRQLSAQLGHPIPPDQANALGLDRQVLGEMIAQSALDQRAAQMRLGLPDAEIARHITTDPNLQTVNGQFDSVRFRAVLQNMGYTEQRFLAEQRQNIVRRQILDAVSGGMTPPKAWIDAVNQLQNQQRGIEYLTLGPAQAGDIAQPTPEQLSKYYDDHKFMFRAAEYRKIDALAVTPTEMAKWMEISDDDVKKAYDAKIASFTTPERRHIEQILFPSMAEAQADADKLKSGSSFAALAAERGMKEADIDLGMITKARMVDPTVADAAFSLKEGETSAPLQGQIGAAIVTVLKIVPAVTKPLADVAPQLRLDIATERGRKQVQAIHDKIEDDRAGGSSLTEVAEKEKLPIVTVTVDRQGLDADGRPAVNLPRGADVIGPAFSTDVGVETLPVDLVTIGSFSFSATSVSELPPARSSSILSWIAWTCFLPRSVAMSRRNCGATSASGLVTAGTILRTVTIAAPI